MHARIPGFTINCQFHGLSDAPVGCDDGPSGGDDSNLHRVWDSVCGVERHGQRWYGDDSCQWNDQHGIRVRER